MVLINMGNVNTTGEIFLVEVDLDAPHKLGYLGLDNLLAIVSVQSSEARHSSPCTTERHYFASRGTGN